MKARVRDEMWWLTGVCSRVRLMVDYTVTERILQTAVSGCVVRWCAGPMTAVRRDRCDLYATRSPAADDRQRHSRAWPFDLDSLSENEAPRGTQRALTHAHRTYLLIILHVTCSQRSVWRPRLISTAQMATLAVNSLHKCRRGRYFVISAPLNLPLQNLTRHMQKFHKWNPACNYNVDTHTSNNDWNDVTIYMYTTQLQRLSTNKSIAYNWL